MSSGSPSSPIWTVSSAGAGVLPREARARTPREVVEPQALELLHQIRGSDAEREQRRGPRPRSVRPLQLGRRLALERADEEAPAPSRATTDAEGAPAVRVAQPGQHLRARHEVREVRQQGLHRLRHARVRGHAPVLAAPVEPAPRQLLDGLVQLLVKREVEDELRLSRVVREEPDLARDAGTGSF